MIEMELVGVRVELPANQPIVLLKETSGTRYLPIWIGAVEATAIAFALQGVETPRPLTHDLFVDVWASSGSNSTPSTSPTCSDGTFFAELHLRQGSARGRSPHAPRTPSRSPAASRTSRSWPPSEVLDEAGLEIERTDVDGEQGVDAEEEVRQFREFLEQVTPSGLRTRELTGRRTRRPRAARAVPGGGARRWSGPLPPRLNPPPRVEVWAAVGRSSSTNLHGTLTPASGRGVASRWEFHGCNSR